MRLSVLFASCSSAKAGITVLEIVFAMTMMGFVALSISNFLIKGAANAESIRMRYKMASELHALVGDIQRDLAQGAYISDNSYNNRLEYTTYDTNGNATKKIYRITTVSTPSGNRQILQLSSNNGATFGSPYRMVDADRYYLNGTPKFLYAGPENNCTDFQDTAAPINGVWVENTDPEVTMACSSSQVAGKISSVTTPELDRPSQASKVILSGFQFTTGMGIPVATRTFPSTIFIAAPQGPVRSTATATAPAVQDKIQVQYFSVSYNVKGLFWDTSRERLLLVGDNSNIYATDRTGIPIDITSSAATTAAVATGSSNLVSVTMADDRTTVLALNSTNNMVYQYNLNTGAITTVNLDPVIDSPVGGIAYDYDDAATPAPKIYVVGEDPNIAVTALRIYELNLNGTTTGNFWNLPADFNTTTHPPSGLAIEPTTGDFLVVRDRITSSTINIYRIDRDTHASTSFSVNISELGLPGGPDSLAINDPTGTTGEFGIAYEPLTNRLFLSDNSNNMIYEIVPPLLISPRG